MAFSRILADDVVDAIFDEDFGLSDGDESDFEGGRDNIHALLGETVLRQADVMADDVDEESTSESKIEEEHDRNDIDMPKASSEHKGLSHVSSLGDVHTEDPCIRRTAVGERRHSALDRHREVRKPKAYTISSV